ncbi:MAG: DUF4397 domain-containing protein [Candidatus Kapabacteria bacterium]|nr:DUF4397 domain-containing protein [Candidatus Kapabacteria bacterium]
MRPILYRWLPAAVAIILLASCGGTEPTTPTVQTSTVRLYNGLTPGKSARVTIAGKPYGSTVQSGGRGPSQQIDAFSEPVEFAIDAGQTTQVYAKATATFPVGTRTSLVTFPGTSIFEPKWYPDTVVVVRDTGSPLAGKARMRVINATDGGTFSLGDLGVYVDEVRKFSITDLPIRSISKWLPVDPGEHQLRVVREWQIPYEAATRGINFIEGGSYTLFLSGTLNLGDTWAFQAKLFTDNDLDAPVDLLIPPDVGSFQIVNAVTGIRSIDVKIDGKIVPTMAQVPFPNATGYIDLDLGTHALEVLTNGTPLVTNVRTVATLRSRKTMFVSGTLVPPNIVGIELAEPERAPNVGKAYIRVVNLCPDSPLLDVALQKDSAESIPDAFRSLEFREVSSVSGGQSQFLALTPGTHTVVVYRAGTKDVILPGVDVQLKPGEVRTLWIGGLLSKIALHSVQHAK